MLGDRIGLRAELQIDAPDIVGLAMHQRRLAGMKGRREPEAALGREIRRHVHVGNQELVLEGHAGEVETEQAADGRARAVGGDEPIGVERYSPSGVSMVSRAPSLRRSRLTTRLLPAQLEVFSSSVNEPGSRFGKLAGITAMTDVTGFGLLGHLVEMADGSGLTARIVYEQVPRLPAVEYYLDLGCVPGGTLRNYDSYASKVGPLRELHKRVLCDPQTSGGLLVAVTAEGEAEFLAVAAELGLKLEPIGQLVERQSHAVEVY